MSYGSGMNMKIPLIAAAVGIVLLAGGAGGAFYFMKGSPTAKYNEAINAYTAGDYASAAQQFEKLGDYRDSKKRSTEAMTKLHYKNAQAFFSTGEYEKAKEEFLACGEYENAAALAEESDRAFHYAKGASLAASGDQDGAIKEYEASGYKDCKDKIAELYMAKADKAVEGGNYDQALEFAKKASDNKGSEEPVFICYYNMGEDAFNKKDLINAASYYVDAEEYKDARDKAKSIYYTLGKDALGKKDYENAATFFCLSKDYKDTASIAKEAFYITGKNRYNEKNYPAAGQFFELAGDYKDSKTLYQASYYNLGISELLAGKYDDAAEHFELCGSYKYAKDLVNVCIGESAIAANKLSTAMSAYKSVSKKASVSGFNIQARKAFITNWYRIDAICRDYLVSTNWVHVEKRTSTQIRGYSFTSLATNQVVSMKYSVNANGTFNVTGVASWARILNCPASKADVKMEVHISRFQFAGIKKLPTTIKLSGGAKLTYKNGIMHVNYNKKSGKTHYQSSIVYR